jgi:hypothetical protein
MRVVPGDQIPNHNLSVAFLRKDGVRQKLSISREVLTGDGAPAVVIFMIEGPFRRLGERHRKQQAREQQACQSAERNASEKHN